MSSLSSVVLSSDSMQQKIQNKPGSWDFQTRRDISHYNKREGSELSNAIMALAIGVLESFSSAEFSLVKLHVKQIICCVLPQWEIVKYEISIS